MSTWISAAGVKSTASPWANRATAIFKVLAPPGKLLVEYRAEVDLDPLIETPEAIKAVAPIDLPLDVLPHLNPSRFCQSDRLGRSPTGSSGKSSAATGW